MVLGVLGAAAVYGNTLGAQHSHASHSAMWAAVALFEASRVLRLPKGAARRRRWTLIAAALAPLVVYACWARAGLDAAWGPVLIAGAIVASEVLRRARRIGEIAPPTSDDLTRQP
jgi:O-antigen ligase